MVKSEGRQATTHWEWGHQGGQGQRPIVIGKWTRCMDMAVERLEAIIHTKPLFMLQQEADNSQTRAITHAGRAAAN
ncbi:hypothetical protein BaRGS_00009398, partial [Batillaria attramentaria]